MRVWDLLVVSGVFWGCWGASPEIISGNCQAQKLPPLSAFGSLTVNPHQALHPQSRLNPHQRPVTNRFQKFQHPAGNLLKSGPVVKVADLEFCWSAKECFEFNISTDVVNSETCIVTYAAEGGAMKEYHVTGNPFYDLYFENLTPIVVCQNGGRFLMRVDGGAIERPLMGSVVKGSSFEFFFKDTSVIFFIENREGSELQFKIDEKRLLTAQKPLTGFIRLVSTSSQRASKRPTSLLKRVHPTAMSLYLLENFAEDFSLSNPFLQEFHQIQAVFFHRDASHFQEGYRKPPHYRLSDPINLSQVYAAYRRYIPVRADLFYTSHSMTFSYTLSSVVSRGDGSNRALAVFPAWKYLQGLKEGVVHTIPGEDEPLQNLTYLDHDLATLLGAKALSGKVTFLEGELPAWYRRDLFIPQTLTFTLSQMTTLTSLLKEVSPFISDLNFEDPHSVLKRALVFAQTGLSAAYFLSATGQEGSMRAITQPFIDHAKSLLTTLLINRTPGTVFFVADQTVGGICAGDFHYNHHVALAGSALLAAAMITEWELLYTKEPLWVQLPVMGADHREYCISDFIDFLWRDVHNPFQDDLDLPYDRCGAPWIGQSMAGGFEVKEKPTFEDPGEDFNCWYGMNAYARCMLKLSLTPEEIARYEAVRDFSEINLKMLSSSMKAR